MLMNIECSIVQSLKVALTFDNNKTKEREIATGDLCYFEFNKNGRRKQIDGKVTKIGLSNTVDPNSWFIVVDGSLDFSGQMERFSPTQILDVDIIQKHNAMEYISTPNDSTRITAMRLCDGRLQVSTDNGYSWVSVGKVICDDIDEDQEGTSNIVCPYYDCRHNKKPVYVEGEDSSYDEDEDSESDVIEDESY